MALGQESDEAWAELTDLLTKIEIKTTAFNKEGDETARNFTLLKVWKEASDRLLTGIANRSGMRSVDHFLYFTICPKLQVFELVDNEKVPGVAWRRYAVSKKGVRFLAYLEKQRIKGAGVAKTTAADDRAGPSSKPGRSKD